MENQSNYMLISSKVDRSAPLAQHGLDVINRAFNEVIANYDKRISELQNRADNSIPTIAQITQCAGLNAIYDPSSYERGTWGFTISADEVEKHYNELLAKGHEVNEAIHAKNLPLIEQNKKVVAKVTELMVAIGIPKTYRDIDRKSRSRSTKYVDCVAGYVGDLQRNVLVSDGYERQLQIENNCRVQLKEYLEKRRAEEYKKSVEAEKAKQEQQKLIKLGAIASRYQLDGDVTADALLDKIILQNKYLYLAHYLSLNRNDWSDGCNYAKIGHRNFVIVSDLDHKIDDEIGGLIENWEGDGRAFRDCTYNYDFLFNLVNEQNSQLYSDYCEIRGNI